MNLIAPPSSHERRSYCVSLNVTSCYGTGSDSLHRPSRTYLSIWHMYPRESPPIFNRQWFGTAHVPHRMPPGVWGSAPHESGPKRHLDRFIRFGRIHGRDRQADKPTYRPCYSVCSSTSLSYAMHAMRPKMWNAHLSRDHTAVRRAPFHTAE